VLIDAGEAMLPFARDQQRLLKRLRDLVGREQVTERSFEGCPKLRRGGEAAPDRGWCDPPAPGTPVLAMTDLGVGRPPPGAARGDVQEWIAFAAVLVRRGCPLIALSPYPAWRVAPALRAVILVVTWDRATRPSAVHRLVRMARAAR
jgi:hypothetical protein